MATSSKASAKTLDRDRRYVLHGIRWRTYKAIRKDLDDRGIRLYLTYDRGSLEIMSPSGRHERRKRRFGRLIEVMTEELQIAICSGGSTTFRRKLKKRGLEPDECYWVEHEPRVRAKEEVDLDVDPPPDIAIEIEYSRSILDKLGVYAALGFPEVWRYDGRSLRVARLQPDGTYVEGDYSPSFPWLPLADLVRFLKLVGTTDETSWIRDFRAWVRAELAPRRARGGGPA